MCPCLHVCLCACHTYIRIPTKIFIYSKQHHNHHLRGNTKWARLVGALAFDDFFFLPLDFFFRFFLSSWAGEANAFVCDRWCSAVRGVVIDGGVRVWSGLVEVEGTVGYVISSYRAWLRLC